MQEEFIVTPGDPSIELLGSLDTVTTHTGIRPGRLRAASLEQVPDDFMRAMVGTAAGVRLRFATTSSRLALRLVVRPLELMAPLGRLPAHVDLVIDGTRHSSREVGTGAARFDPDVGILELLEAVTEEVVFADLGSEDKVVELWLPHTALVEIVTLEGDRGFRRAPSAGPRWLHHGSSISHCLEAPHPTDTWPAVAAARLGLDLIDLGFAGSAMLDPFVARSIRDTNADIISLKLGINLVNADAARLRVFEPLVHGFLDTVREGHPTTPLVVISPIICPAVERTPGPTMLDPNTGMVVSTAVPPFVAGALTLEVIRASLSHIVETRSRTDPHLHLLNGRALFDEPDVWAGMLPDGLHPDERGYRLMGERFAQELPRLLGRGGPMPSVLERI